MMNMKRIVLYSSLPVLAAVLSGCCTFCDEVRSCGTDTMTSRQGDDVVCVPAWETVCGEGTVLNVKREHVPPPSGEIEGGVGGERECVPEDST